MIQHFQLKIFKKIILWGKSPRVVLPTVKRFFAQYGCLEVELE